MFVGASKEDIATPALLIDLDLLESNIKVMGDYYRSKKGSALLPHQKGHRLPVIAHKQLQAGAIGVSMSSLGLAEYYVESGIDNILVTAEIYGDTKIARLCALSKHSNVTVSVDCIDNARHLSEMARTHGTKINVSVELYMGKTSCGVQLDDAKSLVRDLQGLSGINFKGLWWHEIFSNECMKNFEMRKKDNFQTLDKIATVRDEIEDAGVSIEMMSGGYTCTWNIAPEYAGLKNIGVQAGSYVFSDWISHDPRFVQGIDMFDCALTVLTRCISRPKPDEAIFDFGMNSCSDECNENYTLVVGPKFKDKEGFEEIYQREEIAFARLKKWQGRGNLAQLRTWPLLNSFHLSLICEKLFGHRARIY
jgi:D-serine deaminase-like pyridoxal phosphate-dependent protein